MASIFETIRLSTLFRLLSWVALIFAAFTVTLSVIEFLLAGTTRVLQVTVDYYMLLWRGFKFEAIFVTVAGALLVAVWGYQAYLFIIQRNRPSDE